MTYDVTRFILLSLLVGGGGSDISLYTSDTDTTTTATAMDTAENAEICGGVTQARALEDAAVAAELAKAVRDSLGWGPAAYTRSLFSTT